MSKNDINVLGDLIKDLISIASQKNDDIDLNLEFDDDLSIDELLNGIKKEDSFQDRLKYASDLMNKNIKSAEEKVKNKERKILVDSPMDVSNKDTTKDDKCSCGCGCSDKNKLNVKNSFTASSLNEQKEDKVKLINVNKTAEKILTKIYDDIKLNANKKSIEYDFMDEQWDDLLLNVRLVTVLKVLERVANHLKANGFFVTTSNVYTEDSIVELYMAIDW